MINILKLRQMEKEKKSQEGAIKQESAVKEEEITVEFPVIEETEVLQQEPGFEMPEITASEMVMELSAEEMESAEEMRVGSSVSNESEMSEEISSEGETAEELDAAERFRLNLIEQILQDETMISRSELQKEYDQQELLTSKDSEKISLPEEKQEVNAAETIMSKAESKVLTESKKQSSYENNEEQKTRKVKDSVIQLVGFTIGKEYYGIEIKRIKEINRMTEITKVPRAPQFIEGVINLRGTVIPVINLRTKVRMPKKGYDKDTRIIIVELSGKTIGFIVDGVREVLRIPEHLLDPPPALAVGKRAEYITAVAKLENDLVILIDPEKILSNEETSKLK